MQIKLRTTSHLIQPQIGKYIEVEEMKKPLMDENNQEQEDELALEDNLSKHLEKPGVAQKKVREHNSKLILTYLREQGPTLRAQLAENLGLSRATVTHIVKTLFDENLVIAEEEPYLFGGKLTHRIRFNANHGQIIGIDLGRSRLRVYLTNLAADIIDECSIAFTVQALLEQGLSTLAENIQNLVQHQPGGWQTIRGIGMGIPGSANREATQIISPPMLKHWKAMNIPARLKELLNLAPQFPFYLDNDANLGALGENRYGQGRGVKNMIYIKLSSGIGAGLILNGEVYRGENGIAGEFGHIRIQFGQGVALDSPICPSCGERGCLEVVAGLSAVVKQVQSASPGFFATPFSEHEITPAHMAEIIQGAEGGDTICRTALSEAGERIGAAIGGCLINVYNPALILLDGGMIRPTRDGKVYVNYILVESLKNSAKRASLEAAWNDRLLSYGQLGDNAVGLGAVATVIDDDPRLNISTVI